MTDQDAPAEQGPTVVAGVLWGLAIGVVAWALFFVQASRLDLFPWNMYVLPAVGLVAVIAAVTAALRPRVREFSVGLMFGVVAMVPIAFAAILVLFTVLNLE